MKWIRRTIAAILMDNLTTNQLELVLQSVEYSIEMRNKSIEHSRDSEERAQLREKRDEYNEIREALAKDLQERQARELYKGQKIT